MAINIGDAVMKLGVDSKDFDRDMKGIKNKLIGHSRAIGMAMTGVGVAGLKIIESTKELNAKLGVTALNLGISTGEMRDLALETTNVTFPIKEVIGTFDLLARAGVEDQQVLKDTATAFDTLGDAIGMPASAVTENLIPTMKTFGLSADELAGKTDAMTYLFRNTTVSLEDFNRMVGYVTPDLVEMGLTTEDMIAILADLEDQGYSGEVMTREFRKAVTEATKEQKPLNEALGISTEKIESYKKELEDATGLTQEYADVANEQYTIMDKLKQSWSEMTLKMSGFLEPLEPVMAAMTALGPMLIFLSTSVGMATFQWIGHTVALIAHRIATIASTIAIKAAAAAQWLWNAAMMANPIGLIIIGVAALIALIVLIAKNWEDVTARMKVAWEAFIGFWKGVGEWLWKPIQWVVDKVLELWGYLKAFWAWLNNLFRRPVRGPSAAEKAAAIWGKGGPAYEAQMAIPGYAEAIGAQKGAIFMRPTLARLGELAPRIPEAAIPLDKRTLERLGLGGGGGYRTANIYFQVDGRTLAQIVGQPLVDEIRLKTGMHI